MWIMESVLIFLVVSLMSSPALGISQSYSCSMVNGKTICENQSSSGNTAMAASGAAVGGGQTYQDVYAGAGNPGGQWDSGRQTVYGTVPGASDGAQSSGASGGAQPTGVSSFSSSSSSSSSDFIPGPVGGFGFVSTGSFPVGGGGFPFGGGYPAQGGAGGSAGSSTAGGFRAGGGGGGFASTGGNPAQGAVGGFATSGVIPFGGGYPPQAPAQNPGATTPDEGQQQEQQPQGFDPFVFVRPFFGGGADAVAGGSPNQEQQQPQGFDPFMFVRPFFGGGAGAVAGGFAGFPFGRR